MGLETLRVKLKGLQTKYAQAQGYQMSLEREMLDKTEEIDTLTQQVTKARKSFAQADGYRMKVERDAKAEIEDLQEQLQKAKG